MKNILIIGATSAIAEHCARLWVERGDNLFLMARDKNRLETIAADLRIRGVAQVDTYALDANNLEQHAAMLDAADAATGGIDTVLIAHGTLSDQKDCEQSVEDTLDEIKTNALSSIALLTLIANRFEIKKNGTIAVITSVAGDRGRASNYVYGSAKAMVATFASGLRQRLYKSNVALVNIKPGFVDTPMTAHLKKGLLWAQPSTVATKIIKAIDQKRDELYVPGFWRIVMAVVKHIPIWIYKKYAF